MNRIKNNFIAYMTLSRKEVVRIIRIWTQTLIPPVITMSLYFIIFGSLIGSRVGDMGGFDYMQFIVPGIIMMAVITSSYSNVASSFFGAKFQKNIDELLVSPVPSWIIIAGYISGGIFRGLGVGVLVTIVSLFFSKIVIHNLFLICLSVFLTSVLFSLAGLLNGIFARKFDDVGIVPTFVLTPLTYLGGVFYSISLLPSLWQNISLFNPILYMVNVFRYGFLGVSDINVIYALSIIIGFIVVFYSIAIYFLKKGYGMRT